MQDTHVPSFLRQMLDYDAQDHIASGRLVRGKFQSFPDDAHFQFAGRLRGGSGRGSSSGVRQVPPIDV